MKRAVEMQFNWIFILIAGAVILSFFMGVFTWYKASKTEDIARDALSSIKATLTSAQSSSNTAKIVEIPNTPLRFECRPTSCGPFGCDSRIEFKGTGQAQDTPIEVIFAAKEIEGNTLLTWTLPWEVPYKVADFLYLTNPRVRYILVYSDDHPGSLERARLVDKAMDDFNYSSRSLIEADRVSDIRDQNDYLVKFVLFFDPAGNTIWVHDSLVDKTNWDVIFVTEGDMESGKVMFSRVEEVMVSGHRKVQKVPDTNSVYPYVGMPMLLGAVFSESPAHFSCNLRKAYMRLGMVNDLYRKRTEMLAAAMATDAHCLAFYSAETMADFDSIGAEAQKDPQEVDAAAIVTAAEDIMEKDSIGMVKDCARIY
jgi:hypothetical protein